MAEEIEPEESPSPPAQMVDEPDERPRVDEPGERSRTLISASFVPIRLTTSRMAEEIEPEESPSPPAQMVDEPDERPRVDEPWERPRTQVSASIGRRRRCRRFMMIITYPFVIIFFVIFLLLLITFCLFPMMVCLTLGVCIYYCLVEDATPMLVLLRYVLPPDVEETTYPNFYSLSQQRPVIQSKLIIRRVLKIDELLEGAETTNEYSRKHPFPIKISTEHKCLYFSEPILVEESTAEDDGETKETVHKTLPPEPILHQDQQPELDEPQVGVSMIDASTTGLETTETTPETAPEHEDGELVDDSGDGDDFVEKEKSKNESGNVDEESNECDSPDINVDTTDYFGASEIGDRGTTCDICLLEFQVGEDIAWSPNLECSHAFHKDCVLDWLVRKPTCPSCRSDYLKGERDDNV